jgi:NTE family protein
VEGYFDILMSAAEGSAGLGPHRIRRGERLIVQGERSQSIYFVLAGRFRVERDGQHVNYVDAGGVLGEVAFFTGAPRTATVTAYRDSLVYRLTREAYEAICARTPFLADSVAAQLALRMAGQVGNGAGADRGDPPRTATLIAATPDIPLAALAERLIALIARYRPARAVGEADFRADLGNADLECDAALSGFTALERQAGFVLYRTDGGSDAWQRAAVRQSDQVIVVARAGKPPLLHDIERFAYGHIPVDQRRLVLLQKTRQVMVHGTADWFETRPAAHYHHAWDGDDADLARLARSLSGTAVGMVCSGGGAFGAAHAGVHEAFRQAGASFDAYGGTSVGCAMAMAFALGQDIAEIEERATSMFVRGRALGRLTLPRHAVLEHRVFDAALVGNFGAGNIEDLWTPVFAVAANLDEDRLEVLRRGPIWAAVRASSALPGILPPFVSAAGHLLVDGGILDNLPHRAMRELKTGPNLVVWLNHRRRGGQYDYDAIPGRSRLLMDLLTPRRSRKLPVPGIAETIIRSMTAGRTSDITTLGESDLLLVPPLPADMTFLNWRRTGEIIAAARAYAAREVEQLQAEEPLRWQALTGALGCSRDAPRT